MASWQIFSSMMKSKICLRRRQWNSQNLVFACEPPRIAATEGLSSSAHNSAFYSIVMEPESMMRAARFDDSHADPFDRMIAAQAIQNNLPLLSTDPRLDVVGVRRLKKPGR
jgi:hypothetical protein